MDTSFFDDLEALVNGYLTAVYNTTSNVIETRLITDATELMLYPDMTTLSLIMTNYHEDTMYHCPYFYVMTFGNGPCVPINYQYLHFLRLIGVPSTVSARVETAVVVGSMDAFGKNLCSVPMELLDPMSSIWDWMAINLCSCEPCHEHNRRCDLGRPCKKCTTEKLTCVPRDDVHRIMTLYNAVASGNVCHHDLARYMLYLQGRLYDTRGLDAKVEVEYVERRLNLCERSMTKPPPIGATTLPEGIKEMVEMYVEMACIRIEWLYNGTYYASYNQLWAENFYTFDQIRKLQKQTRVHPKLIETLGFASPMRAYNMFVESLARMGNVVEWTGHFFWEKGTVEKLAIVKMKTLMHDAKHLINLTICEKLG